MRRAWRVVSALGLLCWAAAPAAAHGIWGHIHVTGWAIENQPPGELRDFFADPEVKNAALFGAAFTDSGYWPQGGELQAATRAYSEHTHWEPFIADFVQWVMDNDPPPWTSLESRKRVAFLLGCASHGLQDEIFDSLFLYQVQRYDDGSQDNADPGTDGFLSLDGYIRLIPEPYIPMDTLLELYADLPETITEEVIDYAVGIMTSVYVNDEAGPEVAAALGETHAPDLPWTQDHFMDASIPGSLKSEIIPTMAYQQAIWERLHGTFDAEDVVVSTFPQAPRRLRGVDASTPDPWVTLVYGVGVQRDSPSAAWTDSEGADVAFERKNTRWNAEWTRLHRYQPTASLQPGEWYAINVAPGLELIDGRTTSEAFTFELQAPCETDGDAACPDLGEIWEPSTDGPTTEPEAEPETAPEAMPDVGPDVGPEPAPELAAEDAGDTSGSAETMAAPGAADDGCAGSRPGAPWWLLIVGLLLVVRRRAE